MLWLSDSLIFGQGAARCWGAEFWHYGWDCSGIGPRDSERQAANPPPAVDVAKDGMAPPGAALLVSDLEPLVPGGDGGIVMEDSEEIP